MSTSGIVIGCHDPSPLKYVDDEAVPLPSLPVGTVPDPKFEAFNEVKLAPEPLKVVAVAVPVIVMPEGVVSSLVV